MIKTILNTLYKNSKWSLALLVVVVVFFGCSDKEQQQTIVSIEIDPSIQKLIDDHNKLLKQTPTDALLYAQRAALYREAGDFEHTIDDLEAAISYDSLNIQYALFLSQIWMDEKNPIQDNNGHKAQVTLETQQKRTPNDPLLLSRLIELQLGNLDFESALKMAQHLQQLFPLDFQPNFLLGSSYKAANSPKQAISSFQEALRIQPDDIPTLLALSELHKETDALKALNFVDRALSIMPNHEDALYLKARIHYGMGELTKAKAIYEKFILNNPQDRSALYNLGALYFDLDSMKKAHRFFNLAVQVDPSYADGYYMRGYSLEMMGRKDSAIRDYKYTLKFDENHLLAKEALQELKPTN